MMEFELEKARGWCAFFSVFICDGSAGFGVKVE